MRISEAAELTGLTISNIRFYEKKGLLDPARNQQSKYRDYSLEDIYRLKQIVLYRKMDIPIETIHILLCHETTLEQVLEQQMIILKEKQEMLQGSIDLCEAVLVNSSSGQLDIDYYLNYVKTEEANGRKFAEIEEWLTEFAAYTKFDLWAANPIVSRFLWTPKAVRIARIIWVIAVFLIPVIIMVGGCIDRNGITVKELLYWIFLFVVWWGPFVYFRRNYRE